MIKMKLSIDNTRTMYWTKVPNVGLHNIILKRHRLNVGNNIEYYL